MANTEKKIGKKISETDKQIREKSKKNFRFIKRKNKKKRMKPEENLKSLI